MKVVEWQRPDEERERERRLRAQGTLLDFEAKVVFSWREETEHFIVDSKPLTLQPQRRKQSVSSQKEQHTNKQQQ
jgi:hypothetical protein